MRLLATALVAIATTASVIPMSGCNLFGQKVEDSPRGVYFETQEAFIFAVAVALDRKRAGAIDQDDWDTKFNPAIQLGNNLLDEMEHASIEGDFQTLAFARITLAEVVRTIEGGE